MDISSEYEIALIYIGSSGCFYCNQPAVAESFKRLETFLNNVTNENNYSMTKIGLSIEHDPAIGYQHLSEIAVFNEISTGNDIRNISVSALLDGEENILNMIATPQILLVKRRYKTVNDSLEINLLPVIVDQELLAYFIGSDKMKRINDLSVDELKNLTGL